MSNKAKLGSVLLVVIVMGLPLACNTTAPGKAADSASGTSAHWVAPYWRVLGRSPRELNSSRIAWAIRSYPSAFGCRWSR